VSPAPIEASAARPRDSISRNTDGTPSQAYAHLKLRSLGAATAQGISFFSRQLADAAQNLPPDAVTRGDTWAQSAYQQYFGTNPQNDTPRGFNPCRNVGAD